MSYYCNTCCKKHKTGFVCQVPKFKMEIGFGKHHPYCKHTYQIRPSPWTCICDTLGAYDAWRKNARKK